MMPDPRKWSFPSKFICASLALFSVYAAWMIGLDPYMLVSHADLKKSVPYSPWVHYNFIRKTDRLEAAFLGSSAVNYLPISERYNSPDKRLFTMGIESSTLDEHIAYGRLLLDRNPKEIVFFITFYSLNPARPHQPYFNAHALTFQNSVTDFLWEYGNVEALSRSVELFKKIVFRSPRSAVFRQDGTRTEPPASLGQTENQIRDYLVWLHEDPRYYASAAFQNPNSTRHGVEQIRKFKQEAERRGVRLVLALAPTHRSDLAVIYAMGLGPSYERFREDLASVDSFTDFNIDTNFTRDEHNFFDTHHVRNGTAVVSGIGRTDLLITSANAAQTAAISRPSREEIARVQRLIRKSLRTVQGQKIRSAVLQDLARNPARTD